jgi:hypothetical protein
MEEAWQRCLDLLALRRSQPNRFGVGVALLNCASMAVERRQAGLALPYLAEALQVGQEVHSRYLTQALVTGTAEWAVLTGDVALATRLNAADRAQRGLLQMPLDAEGTAQRAAQMESAHVTLGSERCDAEVEAGSAATHDETLAWAALALRPAGDRQRAA